MGVATSTHGEHAVPELERQGVLPYFQAVVTGDQVTKGKPDPEIYSLACRKLGADPQESWLWRTPTAGSALPRRQG